MDRRSVCLDKMSAPARVHPMDTVPSQAPDSVALEGLRPTKVTISAVERASRVRPAGPQLPPARMQSDSVLDAKQQE